MKTILEFLDLHSLASTESQIVELIDEESERCISSGDLLGAGEWHVSKLRYCKHAGQADPLLAKIIALWASASDLVFSPENLHDLVRNIGSFSPDAQDQNCEMQMRDLRTYCAARGFTISREYIDIGQSGAKDSRPDLKELMADARKRRFDSILVWRFDRFARSTKHLLLALEEFRSLGIQFVSYQENIDTSSPLGQALFTIVSAVAQLERDLIRERVSAGVRNARA
ncbi:MAG: putative resolvase [Candidatus Sulfotelmatobacter sp.]|nr:putative resolvase [Candidatus Sulfotelmatobacter sp.]